MRNITEDRKQITEDGRLKAGHGLSAVLCSLSSVLCFLLFCPGATGEELQFKFQPGDKYFLSSDIEQKTTQVVDGNEQVSKQTTRIGCDLDIIEVDENDCAWAKYTYKQAFLKVQKPNYTIEFDSEANQARVPNDALPLQLVLGENLFLRISPEGRIIDIKGLSALATSAKAAAPLSSVRYLTFQFIDKNFNETSVRRFLEERLVVFPPLKTEDKGQITEAQPPSVLSPPSSVFWTRISDINDDPPMRTEQWTFRFTERRNGSAFIDVNVIVKTSPDAEEIIAGGAKVRREISGKAAGLIEIEEATGRIINETITWDLIDEIKASAQGPVLRLPPLPAPATTHVVSAFQMIKKEDSPASKIDSQSR